MIRPPDLPKCFLTGTTLMKCLIYDSGGQIVGRHSEPIAILRPEPNRVEIDPHHLWRQFQVCFRNALADAQVLYGFKRGYPEDI